MPRLKSTLIIIADGSKASVYQRRGRIAPLANIGHLSSADARLKNRELVSDRPGRYADDVGDGRHGLVPPTDPHRHSKESFTHELVEFIVAEDRRQRFDRLVIIAAPQTLGALRAALPAGLKDRVDREVAKDLTHLNEFELEDHLRRFEYA